MANTKLMKVMEYLINEQEDKARDLLHQIFIEKARAIHEEMMADDEHMDEDMLGGDMGDDLKQDIAEIDAEEHYEEATDMEDDVDVEDAVEDLGDEMDMGDDEAEDADDVEVEDEVDVDMDVDMEEPADEADEEDMEHKLHDLESAIEELKKEFEALESGEDAEDMGADEEAEDEEHMDEAWETMDEADDFDALDEGIAHDLDTVTAPKSGEAGSGKFARAEVSTHSPVPPTQKDMMGAKPVKTGLGKKAQGYDLEAAPASKSLGAGTGRRKDAEDNKHPVSKEGDTSALLNKDRSEGFGAPNTRSPISGR